MYKHIKPTNCGIVDHDFAKCQTVALTNEISKRVLCVFCVDRNGSTRKYGGSVVMVVM